MQWSDLLEEACEYRAANKGDMRPIRAGGLVAVGIGVGAALGTAFHSLALGLALGAAGGAILAIVVQRR